MLSKTQLQAQIAENLSDPDVISNILKDEIELIPEVYTWLGRLKLLHGVPFNYLVPDERMLPEESIRFFYLDMNWVDALIDGAYSIGRNLSNSPTAVQTDRNVDKATLAMAHVQLSQHVQTVRSTQLGQPDPGVDLETVTGFLLRSRMVQECPTMGIYAYANSEDTPEKNLSDTSKIKRMPILRFEKLGKGSDILLCLLVGDAYRIDIHEAPENLHYGIDSYQMENGKIMKATKGIRTYTKATNNQVTLGKEEQETDITACFRDPAKGGDGRTLNMSKLAGKIADALGKSDFDSAQMGFEMTEGVGLVKFIKV